MKLETILKQQAHEQTVNECIADMTELATDPKQIFEAMQLSADDRITRIKVAVLQGLREWYKQPMSFEVARQFFNTRLPQEDIETAMRAMLAEINKGGQS